MTVVPSTDVTPGTTLNFSSTITNDSWFVGRHPRHAPHTTNSGATADRARLELAGIRRSRDKLWNR